MASRRARASPRRSLRARSSRRLCGPLRAPSSHRAQSRQQRDDHHYTHRAHPEQGLSRPRRRRRVRPRPTLEHVQFGHRTRSRASRDGAPGTSLDVVSRTARGEGGVTVSEKTFLGDAVFQSAREREGDGFAGDTFHIVEVDGSHDVSTRARALERALGGRRI